MQLNSISENPFVGLRPFESTESLLFFGRSSQTGELLERLHSNRFVSVVGRSGCGKSSLIRAGLIPKLQAGFLIADREKWVVATMKPGDRPLRNLAIAVLETTGSETSPKAVADLVDGISARGVETLIEALAPTLDRLEANFLLLADQFEEIFRFGSRGRYDEDELDAAALKSRDEAADFVAMMLALSEQRDVPIYVVMTMRSDFLGDCDTFYGLPEAMNLSQYLVPRLSTQQREEAISGPVRLLGNAITRGLLDLVRNDVGDKLDQLPVMQHAMMRTWESWRAHEERPIDIPDYLAAGTIKQALSDDAETVLQDMTADERQLTMRLFQALTDTDSEGRRIRRPAHILKLVAITGAGREQIMDIVRRFQSGNRAFLTVSLDKVEGNDLIDISHESLIRQWKTLRDWVDQEADDRANYVRVAEDAKRYKRGLGGLWNDPDLQLMLGWWNTRKPNRGWAEQYNPELKPNRLTEDAAGANPSSRQPASTILDEPPLDLYVEAKEFLEEGRRERDREKADQEKQRQRQLRLTRLVALVILVGLVLVSSFAVYAGYERQKAVNERQNALTEARRADKSEQAALEAKASEFRRAEAEKSTRVALQNSEEARFQALKKAQENAEEAEGAKKEAQAQAQKAEASAIAARAAQGEALAQARKAERNEKQNESLVYDSDISLSEHALQDEGARRGDQLLRSYADLPERQRRFEWRYLWRQHHRDFAVFRGHEGNVLSVAASPDGQTLVSGGDDNTVRLWNTATGESRTLSGHTNPVTAVTYAPNGQTIATASADHTVRIWDALSGQEKRVPLKHPDQVNSLAYSPDGNLLATGDAKGGIRLWILNSTAEPRTLRVEGDSVTGIAFSPDGKLLATGGTDFVVSVWNLSSSQKTDRDVRDDFPGSVRSLAFAKFKGQTKLLVCGGPLVIFDVSDTGELNPATVKYVAAGGAFSIAVSRSGETFATSDAFGDTTIWNADGVELLTLWGSGSIDESVLSLAFLSDTTLASGSSDGTARLWDLRPQLKRAVDSAPTLSSSLRQVAFAANGDTAGSVDDAGAINLWDTRSLKKLRTIGANPEKATAIAFSPSQRILASGAENGTIKLWGIDDHRAAGILPAASAATINSLLFSPDGKTLVAGNLNGTLFIWEGADTTSPRLLKKIEVSNDATVIPLAFSPDGKTLAAGGHEGVRLWNAPNWQLNKREYSTADSGGVTSLSFSADSKVLLLIAGYQAKVWDTSREALAVLPGERSCKDSSGAAAECSVLPVGGGGTYEATFSHDGQTIATGSLNGTVKLWDATTRRELTTLKQGGKFGLDNFISSLVFSPDDRMLLVGSAKGSLWLWRGASDKDVEMHRSQRPAAAR